MDENNELFSNQKKKVIGKINLETPKNVTTDNFVCLRSNDYSFKCKDNIENENKIKGTSKSQSKHNKFEDYKKRLDGEEYQRECINYILRSMNHEMHFQEIKKSSLSLFDGKRKYLNIKESIPCN